MSSGERPIGAAKGKQPRTEAFCQPPPPRVQRTIQSSRNTVRTGVFLGYAVRYSIKSVPKPGASLIGFNKNTVRMKVFVGDGIRWTRARGYIACSKPLEKSRGESGKGVALLKGAASGPGRPSHAGAGLPYIQ